MTPAPLQIYRAWKNGIKIPVIAWNEARLAKLEFAVLCAVLEKESSGGQNVFGHDPTIFSGAGLVTREKYLAYRQKRDALGLANNQRRMQGVGPMQLTWWEYQDDADRMGGCWVVRINVRVGANLIARNMKDRGLFRALKAYNGSEEYAFAVMALVKKWRGILGAS